MLIIDFIVSYSQVIRSFALVPLACLFVLAGLALLITFGWAPCPGTPHSNVPYPYRPNVRAFLVGAAGWIVSYASRGPIYGLVTFGGRWATLTSVILAAVFSGKCTFLRGFSFAEHKNG